MKSSATTATTGATSRSSFSKLQARAYASQSEATMFSRTWSAVRDFFGSPHPPPHKVLLELSNDLTPDVLKEEAQRQMRDVQRRLERLKAEVEVFRRDA